MAISLQDNIQIQAGKHIDDKYGPYNDLSSALTSIPSFKRVRGLTVGVLELGSLKEYWFKDGVADINLIEKTTASNGGIAIDTGIRSLSANWQSTFNTVSSLSASWGSSGGGTVLVSITGAQLLQYKTEYYGSSAIYVGTAPTGSSESSNVWTIKKSIFSPAGTFTSSVSALNIAWSNRYSI